MTKFQKPYAITENGEVKFVLYDGTKTKTVCSFYEFNDKLGGFIILNEKGEEVEFMDCIGNFTKKPTKFAKEFNEYINSTDNSVYFRYSNYILYHTTLIEFPSKYLTSKKIQKIVKNEEQFKVKQALKKGELINLIDVVRYKFYARSIYKQKLTKANRLLKKLKNKDQDLYFSL